MPDTTGLDRTPTMATRGTRHIPTLYEIDHQGRMILHLHPGQAKAWASDRRFIFVLAGTQGGKTSFGPHWLYREVRRRGRGDYLAVTSTFPLLKLKMLPEFRRLFENDLRLGWWHAGDKVFTFYPRSREDEHTPTRVIFGSAVNSDSLESATAKGAWLDEVGQDDFRLGSWEAVLRRLALHEGRVLAGTTIYNLGWMKKLAYDRWKAGEPEFDIIQFPSIANPAFPPSEYLRAKRSMPGWKFKMFYRGEYDRPPAQIYSDLDPRTHVIPRFDIPDGWDWYVGVDFGAVNTATIYLTADPSLNPYTRPYYIVHCFCEGKLTTTEHVNLMKQRLGTIEPDPNNPADYDDDGELRGWRWAQNVKAFRGGAKPEEQQRFDWTSLGVPLIRPRFAAVEPGIDRIISLIKTDRLFVFDDLDGLIKEFGEYSREVDEMGEVKEEIKDKDEYHRLDALRYAGQALDVEPIRYFEDPWSR